MLSGYNTIFTGETIEPTACTAILTDIILPKPDWHADGPTPVLTMRSGKSCQLTIGRHTRIVLCLNPHEGAPCQDCGLAISDAVKLHGAAVSLMLHIHKCGTFADNPTELPLAVLLENCGFDAPNTTTSIADITQSIVLMRHEHDEDDANNEHGIVSVLGAMCPLSGVLAANLNAALYTSMRLQINSHNPNPRR